jgi:hypothetical protein
MPTTARPCVASRKKRSPKVRMNVPAVAIWYGTPKRRKSRIARRLKRRPVSRSIHVVRTLPTVAVATSVPIRTPFAPSLQNTTSSTFRES